VKVNKKKKAHGLKHAVREEKEREKRIITAIFLAFILLIVITSAYFTYALLNKSPNQTLSPSSSQPKAAIVDHLSLTFPNRTFIETATDILKKSGYSLDYYPGEEVTVEFYRNIPTHNYSLIILRVHSSAAVLEGKEFVEAPVSLFTSETYAQDKYVWEQLSDQLLIASIATAQPSYYFAITPKFVTSSMNGNFRNTIAIMMGCEGLNNTKMAEAFAEKGAKVYIGWNGSVSASHTDQATINLLQHLILEKQTVRQAVENSMKEVGADPAYSSLLKYYPFEVGEQTIDTRAL